jgi:uncharacterized membrane protein YraQ (UPF0718 family)
MTAIVANLPARIRRIDIAFGAIVAVLLAVAIFDPTQFAPLVLFAGTALAAVSPFLFASIALTAYAAASGADGLIAKVFQGREIPMIFAAALMGGLSPFCSCGVIPLIAALLAMGVPLAPVMAFWLASPIMDPAMFVLTAGTLGFDFAIAKTLAALGVGLLGGFTIWALTHHGLMGQPLRAGVGAVGGCAGAKVQMPQKPVWAYWADAGRRRKFSQSVRRNSVFLGKWLVLAFVLEGVMLAYVPADFIKVLAGGGGFFTILGAAVAGIPAYLNGYAALPLVSGLIEQGMAPGAGMAFLVGGGVTSIPAAIAVFALARLPVFFLYIGLALIGAVVAGLLFQLVG